MEQIIVSCLESRIEKSGNIYGRYILGPFEVGQGITIATALRRSLLSEISGMSITAVEIRGVEHEYSVLPGVQESILDIILNLKQIVLNAEKFTEKKGIGYLDFQGPGIVQARDLKLPSGIRCVNPDQYIAKLEYDGHLVMKFIISTGKNYLIHSSSTIKGLSSSIFFNGQDRVQTQNSLLDVDHFSRHILPIDSVFMPVNKVNFLVEVDDHSQTPKERIILEIWTNGSIHPRHAIHKASSALIRLFSMFRKSNSINFLSLNSLPFSTQNLYKQTELLKNEKAYTSPISLQKSFFSIDIANLDLSLQTYIALKQLNIDTIKDLLQYSSNDLILLKQFYQKSVEEIQKNLYKFGFELKVGV